MLAGWKGSFNGDLHMYGNSGVQFYTQQKTVSSSDLLMLCQTLCSIMTHHNFESG